MVVVTTFNQFERVIITDNDLSTAAEFLRAYLARKLPDSLGSADWVLARGLKVAIVVTYARPFTMRKDRFGKQEPKEMLSFLTMSLPHLGLHETVLCKRNTISGHSDARPLHVAADGRTSIMHYDLPAFEKWEAEGLLQNVNRMRALLGTIYEATSSGQ